MPVFQEVEAEQTLSKMALAVLEFGQNCPVHPPNELNSTTKSALSQVYFAHGLFSPTPSENGLSNSAKSFFATVSFAQCTVWPSTNWVTFLLFHTSFGTPEDATNSHCRMTFSFGDLTCISVHGKLFGAFFICQGGYEPVKFQ